MVQKLNYQFHCPACGEQNASINERTFCQGMDSEIRYIFEDAGETTGAEYGETIGFGEVDTVEYACAACGTKVPVDEETDFNFPLDALLAYLRAHHEVREDKE